MSTNPPNLPGFPVVLNRCAYLLEVVDWYHRVQWAHSKAVPTMEKYESLLQYLARTNKKDHLNILLCGIPLESRVLEFRELMRTFLAINSLNTTNPQDVFAGILVHFNMTRELYLRLKADETAVGRFEDIGNEAIHEAGRTATNPLLIEGPPHPALGSSASYPVIIPDTPDPPMASIFITKSIVRKLLRMMSGIVERSETQLANLESNIKRNEQSFQSSYMSLVQKHEQEMDRLLASRMAKLVVQTQKLAQAHQEICDLQSEMAKLTNGFDLSWRRSTH
ncbi:hypothetical protein PtA15_10A317 [Puccinia triticina]|uniref:Uncharacterized protein n=1 Tax=Puccinia triticina TaxID=208348 RepID=A0ABY7CYM7_9BASI|nr:uncharacterized protein PtA15_10A317 [Puccinia triticina]WAQ88895.1 hypothetical protein PtA15_10A317 [Puccinia triticina]